MKLPAAAVGLQRWLPKTLISACVYRAARSRRVWLKRMLIRWFARRFDVDLTDAARGRLDDYASFNDFFTRELKDGARPLGGGEASVLAPVDGLVAQLGTLRDRQLMQAKGIDYRLEDLLGERGAGAAAFRGGRYATLYLAPRHYHRVHMPAAGRLLRTRYIPGERFAVNDASARAIPGLYCRNERVVCHFDSDGGSFALVLVGALNVSSISTVAQGEIASGAAREWRERAPRAFARGAEIGRFNLGSTVIVLFPGDGVVWDETLAPGDAIRMGEPIGTRAPRAGAAAREAP
jgi:phosphatidylserine decarboxylase